MGGKIGFHGTFGRTQMVRFGRALRAAPLLCLLPFSPALPAPPGTGREATTPQTAVIKVCTGCHGIEIVMDTPKDYDEWHDTVQEMIDRGAKGTPAEFDLVMQFLYENMTRIDVNHADADTLGAVLHAPPAAVAAIVARRQTQPFKDLADLKAAIPGLDPAVLGAKTRMILFQ